MDDKKLKENIEKAIRETLVVQNSESIHHAVDKIVKLIQSKL